MSYLKVIIILSVSVVVTLRDKPSSMMNEDDCELYKPVRFNKIEVVRNMLSNGDVERVNVKLYNNHGSRHTLLNTAIEFDYVDMVELLLQYGANVNTLDHIGYSPLHVALRRHTPQSCPAIVLLLLKYGANIETRVLERIEATPLCIAVMENDAEITRILLQHGADVDAATINGNTPLMNAVRLGHTEIFHILLEFTPNIFMRNFRNDTAETCGYATRQTEFALEYQRQRSHMTTILRDLRRNIEDNCVLFALGQHRHPASGSEVSNLDNDVVNEIIKIVFETKSSAR